MATNRQPIYCRKLCHIIFKRKGWRGAKKWEATLRTFYLETSAAILPSLLSRCFHQVKKGLVLYLYTSDKRMCNLYHLMSEIVAVSTTSQLNKKKGYIALKVVSPITQTIMNSVIFNVVCDMKDHRAVLWKK